MISRDEPGHIVVACNGSPMVIGLGSGKSFIASETTAFNKYTKNFIAMQDGEIGIVTADGATFANSKDLASRVQQAPDLEVCGVCGAVAEGGGGPAWAAGERGFVRRRRRENKVGVR